MGAFTVGGGVSDYLIRVVDGQPTVLADKEFVYYSSQVGGSAYETVTTPGGDEVPGGVAKTGLDGAIPVLDVEGGINTPAGAWLDAGPGLLPERKWVQAHATGGGGGGGGDGDYLELTQYLGLNSKGRLRIGGSPPRLQIATNAPNFNTWNDVDSGGGGGDGSDADALYVVVWDATNSVWRRMTDPTELTARPAIGTRRILFLSKAPGVTVPEWMGPNDAVLIATT